ncbi:metallophosphoesterase [Parapedobacter defluvii]|uniref:metallophosphoesterase n=1 Tax=Parapedobacter defluvii TaxID=2045106 RepID=UPI00333FDD6C
MGTFNRMQLLLAGMALAWAGCASDRSDEVFSIIVLPDTQIYSKDDSIWRNSSKREVFYAMTDWVAKTAASENIKFVLHVGDVVNDNDQPYQWDNAAGAMKVLDGVVPTAIALGNHDMEFETRNTANFDRTFPGVERNACYFFDSGSLQFMVLKLELGPTDETLAWANDVLAQHADKQVIVLTHSYMLAEDRRDYPGGFGYLPPGSNTGEEIWEKLIRHHAHVFLVVCGHVTNNGMHRGMLASEGVHGNTVYQLLCGEGHDGWLYQLRFDPKAGHISVETYSPWSPHSPAAQLYQYGTALPGYNLDSLHQYHLPYHFKNTYQQ